MSWAIVGASAPAIIGAAGGIGASLISRKKGGGSPSISMIPGIQYSGAVPYSASQVGLDEKNLSSLGNQYTKQLLDRSQGQGLVGFDPRRREILKSEFLADLGEEEQRKRELLQAQSASQGLRGGIPMDQSVELARNFSRARASGLADIDVEDLEARRQDINTATYAQPEAVRLGAGIQGQRAAFDLQRAMAEAGIPVVTPQAQGGGIGDIASAFAMMAGVDGFKGLKDLFTSGANRSTSVGIPSGAFNEIIGLQNLVNKSPAASQFIPEGLLPFTRRY